MTDMDIEQTLIIDMCEVGLLDKESEEVKAALAHFERRANNNMGIPVSLFSFLPYVFVDEGQDKGQEYDKIMRVLDRYVAKYVHEHQTVASSVNVRFINYGRTELVFVLSDESAGCKNTLLVKQPNVPFGYVKAEMQNLLSLKKVDENVVAPIDYYCDKEGELYVTPYMTQARCIASDDGVWGVYVPEPYYRFDSFTDSASHVITAGMIAKLISYYDMDKKEGIAACKLGGGDFMLPKGWEEMDINYSNVLDNLYLIAAREKIRCSFYEYVQIIWDEFSRTTIMEDQSELKINHRARAAMAEEDIEKGIEMGIALLKQRGVSEDEMCK